MSQQNKQHGELFSGSDFGEKVSFTVGSSYGVGFLLGLARGFRQGIPKSFKMPRKLIMNNFFNAVGK
jgi:import inner membrane translocase subunit TIM23